jgi:hypothetical protein
MSTGEKIVILNVDDLEAQRYVKTRDLRASGYDALAERMARRVAEGD